MQNNMVDLETLGTVPGCAILSIGAVFFDPNTGKLGSEFYEVVSTESCLELGLHTDPGTIEWWSKQKPEAQKVVQEAKEPTALHLRDALEQFNAYLATQKGVRVWGNGADFDNPILAAAYKAAGVKQGWLPYNGRCYRTIKSLFPNNKAERGGIYHNALDDAKTQAQHLIALRRLLPPTVCL